MKEILSSDELPRDKNLQFNKPDIALVVKLPFCEINSGSKLSRQSMHTDMMATFLRTIESLKAPYRKGLLIEGRVLTYGQWDELQMHPAYGFFLNSRLERADLQSRKKMVNILLPKDTKLTSEQVRRYHGLTFTPNSLSKTIGFRVGWYHADFLENLTNEDYFGSYRVVEPYIGGVNQFRIGSDTLKPGIVRMIATRMMFNFENATNSIVRSRIDRNVLEASAKIFKFG